MKEYFTDIQTKIDYDKLGINIFSKIDSKLFFNNEEIILNLWNVECSYCDCGPLDDSKSLIINEIFYNNFWSKKNILRILTKFPNNQVILYNIPNFLKKDKEEYSFIKNIRKEYTVQNGEIFIRGTKTNSVKSRVKVNIYLKPTYKELGISMIIDEKGVAKHYSYDYNTSTLKNIDIIEFHRHFKPFRY